MIIKVKNNLDIKAQYSFLSNSEVSAVSTLRVRNINQFYNQWAIQIGKTGEEKTEIRVINATPSGTSLAISAATSYDHPEDTPVYSIKFDQIVFERSTVGTAGTATPIGTVSITPDSDYTQFDDTTGAAAYAYKTYFQNSVSNVMSSESDWLTSAGFSFYSKAKLKERVKGKLLDSGYIKDDSVIDDWLNEWLEVLNNEAIKVNKSYGMGTVDVAFGTTGLGTISSNDFISLKNMWITYNGNDFYAATQTDMNQIYPNQTFNETHPYFSWRGDSVFKINPEETGGTARIHYYNIRTLLVDDTDELPVLMRPYTRSFVDYALSEALYQDTKEARADRYSIRAEGDKKNFVSQITPRNNTGIQMIQIDTITSSEDEFLDIF
jgi:hypothetical protein